MRFVVLALAGERLVELLLSRRNVRRLRARGAIEVGAWQLPAMSLANLGLFWGLLSEGRPPLRKGPLALAGIAQLLRYWAVRSLDGNWSVRVLVVPGSRAVVRGPYRFVRHPNYLAVILEAVSLPLAVNARRTAAAYTLTMAALLVFRIRSEERALADFAHYAERLGETPRFVPRKALR